MSLRRLPRLAPLVALAVLAALAPSAASGTGTGCTGEAVCVFECAPGETVHVWARNGAASDVGGEPLVATAVCGGALAACADVAGSFEHAECGASSGARTRAAGPGACQAMGAAVQVSCWSA